MAHPRKSSSYEQTFHLLIEILGKPGHAKDIEIKKETEKEAIKFRLKYYSFQRVLESEAEIEMVLARKSAQSDKLARAEETLRKLKNSRRFKAVLEGNTIRFTDRDLADTANIDMLLGILQEEQGHSNDDLIRNQTSGNSFEQMLITTVQEQKDNRPAPPVNPLDQVLAETRDTPVGLTVNALFERTATRLKHGSTDSFTLPFDSQESAQDFAMQWAAFKLTQADLPPHTVTTDGKVIMFNRNILGDLG